VRGIVLPPGVPADIQAYWEDVFARLARTATWKKYLDDNQFEDGFQKRDEFVKFLDKHHEEMRTMLSEAGVKLVR
jgi:putative tricarboxylic transport membrane protein